MEDTLASLHLLFAWNIFFYAFTFNLFVKSRYVHSFLKIPFDNVCPLIGVFNSLIFNKSTNMLDFSLPFNYCLLPVVFLPLLPFLPPFGLFECFPEFYFNLYWLFSYTSFCFLKWLF